MSIEKKTLRALLSKSVWDRFSKVLNETFFETTWGAAVFSTLKVYWEYATRDTVNLEVFESLLLRNHATNPEDESKLLRYFRTLAVLEIDDENLLVRQALVNWKAKKTLFRLEESLDGNEFDPRGAARELLELASACDRITPEDSPSPASMVAEILTEESASILYPTNIPILDDSLDGGLWGGELGVLVGPSFRGKTEGLVHLGASRLKAHQGPVVAITAEISGKRLAIRYYQHLLGTSRAAILANPTGSQEAIERMSLPYWKIVDVSSSGLSTIDIETIIEKAPKDSLIIFDQLEVETIRPRGRYTEPYLALGAVTEELHQIALAYNVGIWTAAQANRPGYGIKWIGLEHIANSMGIGRRADVVISLNQDDDERVANTMRLYVCKARERILGGENKRIIPIRINHHAQEFIGDLV